MNKSKAQPTTNLPVGPLRLGSNLLSLSLGCVGHEHPASIQTKVLPEALFEQIGEPVELRPSREYVPNPQNPPSPAPLAGEAIRRPDFTDSELELRVVCDRCLDLHVPLLTPMTELEIEAVAVARFVRLSLYPRQNFQPVFRNPRVPSHDVAPEFRAQETVRMDLADDPRQIAEIGR